MIIFYKYNYNNIKVASQIDYQNDIDQQMNMKIYINNIIEKGDEPISYIFANFIEYFDARSKEDLEFNGDGEEYEKEYMRQFNFRHDYNIDFSESMTHIWCFYLTFVSKLTGLGPKFDRDITHGMIYYDIIDDLPTYDECCICYEKTNVKTECNHSVCETCLNKIIEKQNKKCPMCRHALDITEQDFPFERVVLAIKNKKINFFNMSYVAEKNKYFLGELQKQHVLSIISIDHYSYLL